MTSVLEILAELESTGGRLLKEEILETNSGNDLLKKIFVAALDPYTDYGVRKFKKVPPSAGVDDDGCMTLFLILLSKLATRELSGNAAKDAVTLAFSTMNANQQKWCERLLLKNLRCGVDSTVNRVWPNLIKGFEVALAKTLSTTHDKSTGIHITDDVNYPVWVDPKLDGLRCIAVKANGVVTLYTRNGTVLETLPRIQAALEKAPYDNYVLDGEAMGEDWNESASVLMSSKGKKDDASIYYNVFDAVKLDEWVAQACDTPYLKRLGAVAFLVEKIDNKAVRGLATGQVVNNEAELMEFYSNTMGHGYEGIMLKDLGAPYRFKRSSAILKMKPVVTYEGVIVGNYEGRVGTKRENLFGGFDVVLPNGVITRVGGGFNDAMRAQIQLEGPDSFNGRIVEMEGQPDPMTKDGLTKDGKIRFPVFMRFRDASDVDPRVVAAYATFVAAASQVP